MIWFVFMHINMHVLKNISKVEKYKYEKLKFLHLIHKCCIKYINKIINDINMQDICKIFQIFIISHMELLSLS